MRKVKRSAFLAGGCALMGGGLLLAGAARADVTSTNSAGLVVFPKLVVDTRSDGSTDTIIQLTNTSSQAVNVRCFLVNANGHCSNTGDICNPEGDPKESDCGSLEQCVPGWQETDFRLRLTPKQPIMWTVSRGLEKLPLADAPTNGFFNDGNIVPAPEDPMVGELKCVQVGEDEAPVDRNDLKGEATIERVAPVKVSAPAEELYVDSRGYNAIGIQAIEGENDGNNTLVLGQEYSACPSVLVLDHFFDDAEVPADTNQDVRTHLTLVPCSEDFNLQAPISTTVQFLVFNEFEQRFSTSRSIRCFSEIVLSDIDTRAGYDGDAQSIFNVKVQGTLTGQTLIRGVADSATTYGHGLLGIAEEFHSGSFPSGAPDGPVYSSAFVAHQRGARTQLDYVYLPEAAPAQ
jgi:hypothetical protein